MENNKYVTLNDNGLPCVNGIEIPNIVKNSLSFETGYNLAKAGLFRVKFEVFLELKELEKLNKAYNKFIANNDAPLNYQVIGTAEMVQNQPTDNL